MMSSFRRRHRFLLDRCGLFATAMLVVGVPALIYSGGLTGVAVLGVTALASMVWVRRRAHAPHRATCTRVVHDDDDDGGEWDADFSHTRELELTHESHHSDFDDEDAQDMDGYESDPFETHPFFPPHDPFGNDCSHGFQVNPASGLPMISGDTSGVDVAGNPFGFSSDHFGAPTSSSHEWL